MVAEEVLTAAEEVEEEEEEAAVEGLRASELARPGQAAARPPDAAMA